MCPQKGVVFLQFSPPSFSHQNENSVVDLEIFPTEILHLFELIGFKAQILIEAAKKGLRNKVNKVFNHTSLS
jgi:hypothetical protein